MMKWYWADDEMMIKWWWDDGEMMRWSWDDHEMMMNRLRVLCILWILWYLIVLCDSPHSYAPHHGGHTCYSHPLPEIINIKNIIFDNFFWPGIKLGTSRGDDLNFKKKISVWNLKDSYTNSYYDVHEQSTHRDTKTWKIEFFMTSWNRTGLGKRYISGHEYS